MKKFNHIFGLLLLLAGCAGPATENTPVTTVFQPQETIIANSSSATSTITPSFPDITPVSTTGSWVLIPDRIMPFIINPDGSGYSPFLPAQSKDFYLLDIATFNNVIAYIESKNNGAPTKDVTLKIRITPGVDKTITYITTGLYPALENKPPELMDTFSALGKLAWSPDGKYLAFTASIDGPTSDVYVYSMENDNIKRLTDGLTQAVSLRWTPDGRYIVHGAAKKLNFGANGRGYDMLSVWVTAPDGSETRKLYDWEVYGIEETFGWIDMSNYLSGYYYALPGEYISLDIVNIDSGETTLLFSNFFTGAYSNSTKQFLLCTLNNYENQQDGLYLFEIGQEPKKISDDIVREISWYPEIGAFIASQWNSSSLEIFPSGEILRTPYLESLPIISPDKNFWATIENELVIGDWDGNIIFRNGTRVNQGKWSPDSKYFYFSEFDRLLIVDISTRAIMNKINMKDGILFFPPVWINP